MMSSIRKVEMLNPLHSFLHLTPLNVIREKRPHLLTAMFPQKSCPIHLSVSAALNPTALYLPLL